MVVRQDRLAHSDSAASKCGFVADLSATHPRRLVQPHKRASCSPSAMRGPPVDTRKLGHAAGRLRRGRFEALGGTPRLQDRCLASEDLLHTPVHPLQSVVRNFAGRPGAPGLCLPVSHGWLLSGPSGARPSPSGRHEFPRLQSSTDSVSVLATRSPPQRPEDPIAPRSEGSESTVLLVPVRLLVR
jgi:hypothetical protein